MVLFSSCTLQDGFEVVLLEQIHELIAVEHEVAGCHLLASADHDILSKVIADIADGIDQIAITVDEDQPIIQALVCELDGIGGHCHIDTLLNDLLRTTGVAPAGLDALDNDIHAAFQLEPLVEACLCILVEAGEEVSSVDLAELPLQDLFDLLDVQSVVDITAHCGHVAAINQKQIAHFGSFI